MNNERNYSKKTLLQNPPGRHRTPQQKKIWYLMEFKYTSDVLPDYLERKHIMTSKQYENFTEANDDRRVGEITTCNRHKTGPG
jgi:hypothetical protein